MRLCLVLFVALILSVSCGDDELRGDLLEYTPRQLEVPAGLNPTLSWVFRVGPVSTEHERFESITDTPWDDWTRVEPARASITINESGLNWDFVQEVILRAYTDDPANAKEVFYLDIIPNNPGNRLNLIPTDFDANLGLLDADEVTFELELAIFSSPPQNLPVILQYSFEGFK